MSDLIILAVSKKITVWESGAKIATLDANAADPADREFAVDIKVPRTLGVKFVGNGAQCELHRRLPAGSLATAGDAATRTLHVEKSNSSNLNNIKFYARPKSRRSDLESPGDSSKRQGRMRSKKWLDYKRGKVLVQIKGY